MLTISKPLSAGQAQTYHAKEFTAPEQNYWKQGGADQGRMAWQSLPTEYGLAGAVGAKDFSRLSEGQHPETAEQLVRHRKVSGVPVGERQDRCAGRASGGLGCDVSQLLNLSP